MTAFAGRAEDWLATEPSGTLLSAVYLDHTRSLGDGLLAQLRELASPARTGPGAVLAATFSTRSPVAGAAWSRALSLHTCFSTLSSAAAARGLTIAGCGDAWPGSGPPFCDYDLDYQSPGQPASLEQALACRDLPAIAAHLAAWSARMPSGTADGLHDAAAAVSAAAAAALGGGAAGAVWVPDLAHPIAVLGRGAAPALDDAAARALISVAQSVLSYSQPGVKVSIPRQPQLRRVVHLYWQMAYVQVRLA